MDHVEELLQKLYKVGRSRGDDKMVWKTIKSAEFMLMSFYSTLELEDEVSFPPMIVWGFWACTKVGSFFFFLQEAVWDGLNYELKRRGYFLQVIVVCENEEESVDHLLIYREKARGLSCFLFSLFGISWVLSYLVKDFLLG